MIKNNDPQLFMLDILFWKSKESNLLVPLRSTHMRSAYLFEDTL